MAFISKFDFSKIIPSQKSFEETYAYLSDFEKALAPQMPGLKSFSKHGDKYHWGFKSFQYSAKTFELKFVTDAIISPTTIELVQNDPSRAILLKWELKTGPLGGTVHFQASLQVEIPLPSLTRMLVEPLLKREVQKWLERYCLNVQNALA